MFSHLQNLMSFLCDLSRRMTMISTAIYLYPLWKKIHPVEGKNFITFLTNWLIYHASVFQGGRGGEGRGGLISCEAREREKSTWVSFFFVRAPKASCNTLTPMLATHLSYHLFLIYRTFDSGRRNLQPPGELMPFFFYPFRPKVSPLFCRMNCYPLGV